MLINNQHEHTGGNNGVHQRRGFGQNHGQNAGQNDCQNAGQNEGQNAGQNWAQTYGQNHGQNEGQNAAQNGKRDFAGSLSGLPIVGELFSKVITSRNTVWLHEKNSKLTSK